VTWEPVNKEFRKSQLYKEFIEDEKKEKQALGNMET
jgi:hypothetical protein